jgi:hypothetical protein
MRRYKKSGHFYHERVIVEFYPFNDPALEVVVEV